jgi:hypothetical protein
MAEETFDTITQRVLAAAQQEGISQAVANNVVDLHRGLVNGTMAFIIWGQWINATPGSPIGNLTINDIRKLFQTSAEDLKRSDKALDHMATSLSDPTTIQRTAERARQANLNILREQVAIGLRSETSPLILRYLDSATSVAQKGFVQQVVSETIQSFGETAAAHAALLSGLDKRGLAGLEEARHFAKGYGYSPYYRAACTATAWTVMFTGYAVLGAAAGAPILAGGFAVTAAGYAVYTAKKLRDEGYW